MITKYSKIGSSLVIESDKGKKLIKFDIDIYVISPTLAGDRAIVLLDPDHPKANANVFCVDEKGAILWRINDPNHLYRLVADPAYRRFRFAGAGFMREGGVQVFNTSYSYTVDEQTGALLDANFEK